ncbi:ankyrin repeat and zinc finger domain-containing protein 1 [Macadamia integrifolia]|uniref:ankyrin repeat and zinc finger domain-containing protein 1 n=1 Tax=Macadamia integrifolia TaxID=60698 RepID=UPI001C4F0C9B|nr:ankyrin repeat and zinc finger domain-containing protein 1 [Macadamia integrifolia]
MATTIRSNGNSDNNNNQVEQRLRSVFDLPSEFFDSCRLLHDGKEDTSTLVVDSSLVSSYEHLEETSAITIGENLKVESLEDQLKTQKVVSRWSCNTCKAEFESLQDQRSHFKSDFHRFNVKLSISGKVTLKEEDFDELTSESVTNDYDISSISGSEDETEKGSCPSNDVQRKTGDSTKQKLFIRLKTGGIVSIWKCLLLDESENLPFDDDKSVYVENGESTSCLGENEIVGRLKRLIREPRDKTCLRVVLLASGGHFAGCVFDGNSIVARKTFHRYVVRAKAGKKQSSKDASGKAANSAGSSLRRYNESALKKEIQELLAAWKPFFDASSCIFVHAPSNNRQLLFTGGKAHFNHQHSFVWHVPLTVRRPTFKEAKRVYNHLTRVVYEKECQPSIKDDSELILSTAQASNPKSNDVQLDQLQNEETAEVSSDLKNSDGLPASTENEIIVTSTVLHEAAMSGNAEKTLELLEQGLDPCVRDSRGRTPYMLADEKEVRNTFRRFMALNLDKWDWHAANVPSPLTKEMEESQAAKQAEKDAKRKAKSKELKKLRKAKEKKAQAEAAVSQIAAIAPRGVGVSSASTVKIQPQSSAAAHISIEEEQKRAREAEREKRAAAAERRMAAAAAATTVTLNARGVKTTYAPSSSEPKGMVGDDISCSCCNASLAGKVPFHRYHYKYCSTSCMHVHGEMLEDE